MASVLQLPKWGLERLVPNRNGIQAALDAYNAAMGEALAIGDANPLFEEIVSAGFYGYHFEPRAGGLDQLVEMQLDTDLLVYVLGSSAAEVVLNVERAVAMGGDLLNYPVFFQFAAAALSTPVPASWPSRTYIDENEVEQVYTISEWFDVPQFEQYPITFDGGTTYLIPNQDPRGQGAYLPASLWINQAGITLRSVDWYLNQLPQA